MGIDQGLIQRQQTDHHPDESHQNREGTGCAAVDAGAFKKVTFWGWT
jgi:hypothetical protein